MRYDAVKDLTYYIIAAPESEECVESFKSLLNLVSEDTKVGLQCALSGHSLEAHIILSKIHCESSQGSINVFRQSMFAQVFSLHLTTPFIVLTVTP